MSIELPYIPDVVSVFPLPEMVLLPRVLLPLHMFEPRYVEMTADALAGEPFLAVAMLRDDWQPLYYTNRAPIHDTVGIGQIVAAEELDDGKYNVLLRGVARARVVEEFGGKAYRRGRIELMRSNAELPDERCRALREQLYQAVQREGACDEEQRRRWLDLLLKKKPISELVDSISGDLPMDVEFRQRILAEPDDETRAVLLIDHFDMLARRARPDLGGGRGISLN